ncbi:hypothetical protein BVRB_007560 [Beta vulgaris subsp. vulgaris]|uniref:Uncharacterized protein n=1 Tax=Beta vulgaris subsp. vulgaris TaxID=3555 RepID=A0A0J8B3G9_BETVV|nr:hypothetical protein BVRB_007560 [Beta vulgaris subsp. vulgaris]
MNAAAIPCVAAYLVGRRCPLPKLGSPLVFHPCSI